MENKINMFNVVSVLSIIVAIGTLIPQAFGEVIPDPIALYHFDGSGGTLSGTAGYSDTVFKVGTKSLDTGSDGYATISNGTGISGTNNWAITAWINPKVANTNNSPISFGTGKFRMQAYSGSWYLFDSGYSNGISLGTPASVNQWQFWAFTADASTAKFKAFQGFYYNGVWYLVERISVDINVLTEGLNGSSVLTLGARNDVGGFKMPSYIDELLIWDTGLTASDIQSVFESGQAGLNIAGPEENPFSLTSDDFPICMMGVSPDSGKYAFLKNMGCDYIHHYGHGVEAGESVSQAVTEALNDLDLAYEHGLRVMMNLNTRDWVNEPDGLATVQQFVAAVKNHPALGFWYLYDEPEGTVTATELQPFYDMLKTEAPNILVANAHHWVPEWATFSDVEEISMPDGYPVRDEAYPLSPLNLVNDFIQAALTGPDVVMPILQCLNYHVYDPQCYDCRFPNAYEIRYWSYSSIIQGARGLVWFNYGRATEAPYNSDWITNIFAPVITDVSGFVDNVSPTHGSIVILDGQDADDNIYTALWRRDSGLWVVVVNGSSIERDLELDISNEVESANLEAWGLTRNVPVKIENGFLRVKAQPWEVFVWQAKKTADVNSDNYVDIQDLSVVASEWLQCSDPANAECDSYWR